MRIGIDLGGTKIAGVALADDGTELLRLRVATPVGDYEATVAAIAELVDGLEEAAGGSGTVGVGHPGELSPATGLIKNANSVVLNGRPLDADLEAALVRPVRMSNDANCFALSEAVDGAGWGAGVVFGVILGTGVGGGIVVDGRLLEGPNAIAGEWGHNPLPWPQEDEIPGRECYCGLRGCIETFLSGPGMAADHVTHTAEQLDAHEIVARAKGAHPDAQATLDRYVDRLARGLASIINVVDPDVVVLGGGLSNIEVLYSQVPAIWGRYVFSDRVDTRLVKNAHGDAGGVRGAAWLWPAA